MHISIIVAVADNLAIGKENGLLCHLPEDLKRFKKITAGSTVVMGRNTWFSLPRRPLPNRRNIVITDIAGEVIDHCIMAYSIEDALSKMESGKENFVIGGASIYRQFMPLAQKLYITRIHHPFEADTFFPEIKKEEWMLVSEEQPEPTEKVHPYSFSYLIYRRNQR